MPKESPERILELLEGLLVEQGIEITDLEYRRENGSQMLRVFIDTEQGVQIETCSRATRLIQNRLEQTDLIYDYLEVSSPGLDRRLTRDKDYERFQGSRIKVKLQRNWEGRKRFEGFLRGYDEAVLRIELEEGMQEIPRELIARVNLDPQL